MSTVWSGVRTAARTRAALEGAWIETLPERIKVLAQVSREIMEGHQVELEVEGPQPRAGSLIACNHLSYLDPLIIMAVVPAMPIAKGEVADWPLIGAGARDTGVVFHQRTRVEQGATVLRQMIRALRAGVSVLNFPEGTTSFGEMLLPFKRGMFGVARIAEAPVVPSHLCFDDRTMCWVGDQGFVPHYLDLLSRPVTRGRLVFGEPIDPRAYPSAEALSHASLSAMKALAA
ncbi:MAG: lysophospholipid acyltransferase family protein [Myxococcota bacterium]